ncbi:hypothetical protein M0M57_01135 [Flavobacterium azooxidireducens]|uniref:Uncharacterized protein n=1 Tax=Flavobacterium azooxidireducens TaxID=1871076 RepID=A0ABY4KGF7_9FLAO|nr:hypothetical protein [Flavobacterium azooxidireducens]UPQ79455.1 hypothetical protein M0M57_01135 [Flavobacterium azooxidireducens]
MFDEIYKYLGITVVSSTTAYLIIKYFSESIFENYLQKRIETHKSELERLNISYQIQFSSLHVERAEVIKSLYNNLHEYKLAIMDFFDGKLNVEKPQEHLKYKLDQWTKYSVDFNATFHKNKIFFSLSQVELMNTIDKEMNKINEGTRSFLSAFKFASEQIDAINNNDSRFLELKRESLQLIDRVMIIEKELETEFRSLLGVELKK